MRKTSKLLLCGALFVLCCLNLHITLAGSKTASELNLENVENVAEGFEIFGYTFNENCRYYKQERAYWDGHEWYKYTCVQGEQEFRPIQECQLGEAYWLTSDGSFYYYDPHWD